MQRTIQYPYSSARIFGISRTAMLVLQVMLLLFVLAVAGCKPSTPYTTGGINLPKLIILLPLVVYMVFNLLLIVLAVWNARVRTMLLTAKGASSKALFPARYIFANLLLYHCKPIRLALFRNYRKQYRQLPHITHWQLDGVQYISPTINGLHSAASWQQTFDNVVYGPHHLYVLTGKSGLGKTSLLEQWTHRTLLQNRTPILLRLGQQISINDALAFQMQHYGGLPFHPQQAREVVATGGFVILLDGFNESTRQEELRTFIDEAAQNNKVILTSQYAPRLEKKWPKAQLRLELFSKEQLHDLFTLKYKLDACYVDRVWEHSLLSDMATLPHTADLIARYIVAHDQLPAFRLDIFQSLRQTIDSGYQALNLEHKAWQLFRNNTQAFAPDAYLPLRFCEQAVEAGILTKEYDGFRFLHERLQRYFTARYLQWQDERPLEEWHKELRAGLGRTYWTDAIGMWHELKIDSLLKGRLTMAAYEDFVLRVAAFSPDIYATRLAGAIALFEQAGRINMTPGYWEEIGRILAVQRKPHASGW